MKNRIIVTSALLLLLLSSISVLGDYDPVKTFLIFFNNPNGEFNITEIAFGINALRNYLVAQNLQAVDIGFSSPSIAQKQLKNYGLKTSAEISGQLIGISGSYSNYKVTMTINLIFDAPSTPDADISDSMQIEGDTMASISDAKAMALSQGLVALFKKNIDKIKALMAK